MCTAEPVSIASLEPCMVFFAGLSFICLFLIQHSMRPDKSWCTLLLIICVCCAALSHMCGGWLRWLSSNQSSWCPLLTPSWIFCTYGAWFFFSSSSNRSSRRLSLSAHRPHVLHITNTAAPAAGLRVCAVLTGSQCFYMVTGTQWECVREESEVTI